MKRCVWILLLAMVFAGTARAEEGWTDLFDGRSLDGWQAGENADAFRVEDGAIVVQGPRSHLFYVGPVADHQFKNFEVEAEMRVSPGANSGLYVHTEYQAEGWPKKGYEIQINNTYEAHGNFRELKKTGSVYGVWNLYASPARDDEWFRMAVRVEGRRIEVRMNDLLVNRYVEPSDPVRTSAMAGRRLEQGTVALQGHDPGSRVAFRKIRVRQLPDSAGPPPLSAEEEAQVRKMEAYAQADIPIVDLHVHLKGGLTVEEVMERSFATGVGAGIAVNCAPGWPVDSDAELQAFDDGLRGWPVFSGIQAEGREWMQPVSLGQIARADYVLGDTMTFEERDGRYVKLWMPEQVQIDDAEDFMDRYVAYHEKVFANEPIDIYANATFLPECLAARYDELWTEPRMKRVIDVCVKNGVAIEISGRYQWPSKKFLVLARDAGACFTLGTNNGDKTPVDRSYCFRMIDELGLKKAQFFIPRSGQSRANR